MGIHERGYQEGEGGAGIASDVGGGQALGHQSNESLLKKFMTSKFPSTLILMELARELTAKLCELKLQRLRRDENQLADDLMNEKFDAFDMDPLKGEDMKWRILDKLMAGADNFH